MGDRHRFRAKWHDYNGGIYFVTICSTEKRHIFGQIVDSQFKPYPLGIIIDDCIKKISEIHPCTEVWNYVIMPNHIHLILSIVGAQYIAPASPTYFDKALNLRCLKSPKHGETVEENHFNSLLAIVIRTFKAAVTRIARAQCIAPLPVWQRNFHEHIIRNQRAFDNIMNYIDTNVENWETDCFAINDTRKK